MMRAWQAALITLSAAGMLAAPLPAVAKAQAASQTALIRVPWSEVGPGWVLDEYTVTSPKAGPAVLYLFSPRGTRYRLASWPDSDTAPRLVAWSPDGTRALFSVGVEQRAEELTLATGKATTFALAGGAAPIGYTTPRGAAIVGYTVGPKGDCSPACSYYRFGQDGVLTGSLGSYQANGVLFSTVGTEFAVGGGKGLKLVSIGGGVIRELPVPGMGPASCYPARWWNDSTILAACEPPSAGPTYAPSIGGMQLWLVPGSGARPTALTQSAAPTQGDSGAWQLRSGLYVNYFWEHGTDIQKQGGCSGCGMVSVPGLADNADAQVVTAAGSWLLVVANSGYASSSGQLVWFNPATGAERWLTRVPRNVYGDSTAIPFYSLQSAICDGPCF